MSMFKSIQDAVSSAMDVAEDLQATKVVSLFQPASGSIDPVTLKVGSRIRYQDIKAIVSAYNERQVDGVGVKVGDKRVVMEVANLINVHMDIDANWAVRIDNVMYDVVNPVRDSMGLTWQLQVRR